MLLSLCLLLLCSCRQGSKSDLALLQEASLHTAQPDSVLSLLGRIACPDRLQGQARVDYALLYTEALNKQDRIGTDDCADTHSPRLLQQTGSRHSACQKLFPFGAHLPAARQRHPCLEAQLAGTCRFASTDTRPYTDAGELRLGVLISQNRFLSASFVALSGNAALCRRTSRYYGLLHHRIQHGEHLHAAEPI